MKLESLRVRDVMSDEVVTVGRNDRLAIADDLMREGRIRHIPVLDEDGVLCGVVTQRDLFRGALLRSLGYGGRAEQHLLDSVPVKEAMRDEPVTIAPEARLRDAAALMIERGIGCLPVVQDGALVGILTEGDFVRLVVGGRATG